MSTEKKKKRKGHSSKLYQFVKILEDDVEIWGHLYMPMNGYLTQFIW